MLTFRRLLNRLPENEAGKALLSGLQGWSYSDLVMHLDDPVPEEAEKRFEEAANRVLNGEPVQYVIGRAPFYGRWFIVDRSVLIPRFDTEILVRNALESADAVKGNRVLDLCTGSGNVGLTLKAERPDLSVTLSDVSDAALEVAEMNRRALRLDVRLMESDLFRDIPDAFDMIVTNPPYIPDGVIDTLDREVREHEPRLALSGGADGLQCYRNLIPEAYAHLESGGVLLAEIGYDQGEAVGRLFKEAGFCDVAVLRDLAGHDRNVKGRK